MPTDAQPVYTVQLKKDVERTMRKLPADLRRRIQQAINAIAKEPRHPGVIAVKGFDSVYRVRVGDWRIVYLVEDEMLIVLVLEVTPRGGAYRRL